MSEACSLLLYIMRLTSHHITRKLGNSALLLFLPRPSFNQQMESSVPLVVT